MKKKKKKKKHIYHEAKCGVNFSAVVLVCVYVVVVIAYYFVESHFVPLGCSKLDREEDPHHCTKALRACLSIFFSKSKDDNIVNVAIIINMLNLECAFCGPLWTWLYNNVCNNVWPIMEMTVQQCRSMYVDGAIIIVAKIYDGCAYY